MARITRTQKYAELRNQLEHGPEAEIKSKELEKYEDRMDSLNIEKPEIVQEEADSIVSLNDLSKILEEEAQAEPATVQEPVAADDVAVAADETGNDEDVYVPFDFDETEIDEPESSEEGELETIEETVVETEEVEPQDVESIAVEAAEEVPQTKSAEAEEAEVIEAEDIDDNYLEECLSEVNEYNKSKGLLTAEEVPLVIANELRNVKANEDGEDDDISNTVTMEIKKILSELDTVADIKDEAEATEDIAEAAESSGASETDVATQAEELPEEVADLLRSYLEPEKTDDTANLGNTVVASSVAEVAKTVEELPSDDSLQSTKQSTLLNETVPLEVTRSYEKEEDDDDLDVEPGPNRILNIILIALIVILVLILAFVGYLILVAQGII